MKILFISLGCDKNTVDSEMMLGILSSRGYEITDSEDDADAAVINTCCFIGIRKRFLGMFILSCILDIRNRKFGVQEGSLSWR